MHYDGIAQSLEPEIALSLLTKCTQHSLNSEYVPRHVQIYRPRCLLIPTWRCPLYLRPSGNSFSAQCSINPAAVGGGDFSPMLTF